MTDELYSLYLETFVMKLAGVSSEALAKSLMWGPTMQERCAVAIAMAGACRQSPVLVSRENLAKDIELLLKVQ